MDPCAVATASPLPAMGTGVRYVPQDDRLLVDVPQGRPAICYGEKIGGRERAGKKMKILI